MGIPATGRIIGFNTATIAKPLLQRLEKARGWDFKTIAFTVAATAVAFTGFQVVSHFIERGRSAHQAHKQKEVLADYFRNQVAATLGIDPRHVTAEKLEAAARVNPTVKQAVDKVNREQANANRASLMGTGAAMAVGGFVPVVGGFAKMAVDGTAMVAGSMASTLFDKDVLEMTDVVAHLDAKKNAGQAISEHDLMLLKISQNQKWQKAFKSTHGYPFHKGTPQQQQEIMNNMPELANFTDIAQRANSGLVQVASLPSMVNAANDNPRSSFVQSLNAQRAAVAPRGQGQGV